MEKEYEVHDELAQFQQMMLRYEATKEYSKAYVLCLNSLKSKELTEAAQIKAKALVKEHLYEVFDKSYDGFELHIDYALDDNWLLDLAIQLGYNDIKRSRISTGWFSSVPSITLASFWSKHNYGLERKKEGGTTIYYSYSWACSDFKMITAICEKLVDLYSLKND